MSVGVLRYMVLFVGGRVGERREAEFACELSCADLVFVLNPSMEHHISKYVCVLEHFSLAALALGVEDLCVDQSTKNFDVCNVILKASCVVRRRVFTFPHLTGSFRLCADAGLLWQLQLR